jgi:hypothetical protein
VTLKSKKGYLLDLKKKRVNTGRKIWRKAKWRGKAAQKSLKSVTTIFFLEKLYGRKLCDMVADLVPSYKVMRFNLSIRVHLLDSVLDFFGAVSNEHGEQFYQKISTMEKLHQVK